VSHLICGGVYDQSTGLLYKGGRYFDPSLGIWLALLPLLVVRRKKRRRGFPWVVVLALCLGGMSGVLTACGPGGGEQIDWEEIEEIEEAICVEIPPDKFRTSQNVDIHSVSGPNATVYSEHEWRVKFELEDKAAVDGWIIQEINSTTQINFHQGAPLDEILHFYEAWPVKGGSRSSSKARGILGARYNDRYMLEYVMDPKGVVKDGKITVQGIVKFYEGDLPLDFEEGKVADAGTWLYSSHAQPPFWDDCGTAHDFEIEWDGKSASGYMRRKNQIYRYTVP